MIFIVFFGEEKAAAQESFGTVIRLPLLVLCVLSVLGGWIPLPFGQLFPALHFGHESSVVNWVTTLAPFAGIAIAYVCFYRRNAGVERLVKTRFGQLLRRFWFSGWGFDWFYQKVFIAPFMFFVRINKDDVVDSFYSLLAWLARLSYRALSFTQTGRVRWYAAVVVLGVVGFVGMGVMR